MFDELWILLQRDQSAPNGNLQKYRTTQNPKSVVSLFLQFCEIGSISLLHLASQSGDGEPPSGRPFLAVVILPTDVAQLHDDSHQFGVGFCPWLCCGGGPLVVRGSNGIFCGRTAPHTCLLFCFSFHFCFTDDDRVVVDDPIAEISSTNHQLGVCWWPPCLAAAVAADGGSVAMALTLTLKRVLIEMAWLARARARSVVGSFVLI